MNHPPRLADRDPAVVYAAQQAHARRQRAVRRECTCSRDDGWHRASCLSLDAPWLQHRRDGSYTLYRNPERSAR